MMGKPVILLLIVLGVLVTHTPLMSQDCDSKAMRKIKKELKKHADKDAFHGGILIAHKGKILLEESIGANTYGIQNSRGTEFDLASIGKMFTAIACSQLEEEGKIRYSDYLVKYLPEFKDKPNWNEITIHQLLTHSSGIPDIFSFQFIENKKAELTITVDDYFKHYAENPYSTVHFENAALEFAPGKQFQYSNSGYLLLGKIIEKISGEAYGNYVEKQILIPSNMRHTKIGTSYGGKSTTLEDMFSFAKAFTSFKLMEKSTYKVLTSGKITIDNNDKHKWGYGCELLFKYNTKIITHKGGTSESKAQLLLFPENNYVVVIYANNNRNGYKEFLKLIKTIKQELS